MSCATIEDTIDPTLLLSEKEIETLAVLGTGDEEKGHAFLIFQKELCEYSISNYEYPSDVAYLVKEIQNPVQFLLRDMTAVELLAKDCKL